MLNRLAGDGQAFVAQAWGRHSHVFRAPSDAFDRYLGVADVDQLLTSSGLRSPALRMARDGTVLPVATYTRTGTIGGVKVSGVVDPRKALDLFSAGASIILQGLHRYWPPLTALVRDLELALGHPCQANAYLTPPGSQGFALHSDTHDVFVLQTFGSKVWEIHERAGRSDDRTKDPEIRELTLEAGTSLYLPTGTGHAARTQDIASLHITVGINRITWRDMVQRVLRELREPSLDEPLPVGYHREPTVLAAELAARLRTVSERMARVDAVATAQAQVAGFFTNRATLVPGGLTDRLRLAGLTDRTVVRRRAGSVCETSTDGGAIRVALGDRELLMPGWLDAPIKAIRAAQSLRPADLAGWLDEPSRLVLIRRLVREGLLETSDWSDA